MKEGDRLTNRIVLSSEISAQHPAKSAIEGALRAALLGLPGEWRVTVVCSVTTDWWVLSVEGPAFKWMTILADSLQQRPTEMSTLLLGALRHSRVLI